MIDYQALRPKLRTGDVVVFSSGGAFARLIRAGQLIGGKRSKWSHVGLVVKDEQHDQILLWESTGISKLKDIETGKKLKGVQTVFLSDRVYDYKGKVAIRQLVCPDVNRARIAETIGDLRPKYAGIPYEKKLIQLARAALDLTKLGRNRKQDLSSLFCSELVAEFFMMCGFLGSDPPSNEYSPADFDDRYSLFMHQGASLGPELRLK